MLLTIIFTPPDDFAVSGDFNHTLVPGTASGSQNRAQSLRYVRYTGVETERPYSRHFRNSKQRMFIFCRFGRTSKHLCHNETLRVFYNRISYIKKKHNIIEKPRSFTYGHAPAPGHTQLGLYQIGRCSITLHCSINRHAMAFETKRRSHELS